MQTPSVARPSKIYPVWDFLVLKYAIWQPCFEAETAFAAKKMSSSSLKKHIFCLDLRAMGRMRK
jgi:hypothetical protein